MRNRILIVFVIVIAGVSLWLWFSISNIIQAQNDVSARFQEVVQYYSDMSLQYVDPLLNVPGASEDDQKTLRLISANLKALTQNPNIDEEYVRLIAVQHEIIAFFTAGSLGESISLDSHFLDWNMNATSRGKVSKLIYDYNQALARYNGSMRGLVGHVIERWTTHWKHVEYLSINGSTETDTLITF